VCVVAQCNPLCRWANVTSDRNPSQVALPRPIPTLELPPGHPAVSKRP
jgi:hypothetical protein